MLTWYNCRVYRKGAAHFSNSIHNVLPMEEVFKSWGPTIWFQKAPMKCTSVPQYLTQKTLTPDKLRSQCKIVWYGIMNLSYGTASRIYHFCNVGTSEATTIYPLCSVFFLIILFAKLTRYIWGYFFYYVIKSAQMCNKQWTIIVISEHPCFRQIHYRRNIKMMVVQF